MLVTARTQPIPDFGRDARGTYACLAPAGQRCRCSGRHPSVTTVLGALAKPALIQWAADAAAARAVAVATDADGIGSAADAARALLSAHDDIRTAHVRQRDAAAARGSTVHRIVEALADDASGPRTEAIPHELITPEVEPYLDGVRAFVADHRPRALVAECVVASRLGYAGTLDAIHVVPGVGKVVRDYKTRKDERRARLYGEEVLQLAAYRYATWIRHGSGEVRRMPRIDAAEVVLLWPGGYRIERVQADRATHAAFLRLFDLYQWRAAHDVNGTPKE